MDYRRLGGSGLKVSEISLGSWLTYGGYVERENAVKSIETAFDEGINFLILPMYTNGVQQKNCLGRRSEHIPVTLMYLQPKYLAKWVMARMTRGCLANISRSNVKPA